MKKTILLGALLLALVSAARAQINPIYARLKGFRTYTHVTATAKQAHHFMVWFLDIEPSVANVAANSVDEMQALAETDLHLAWGAFGMPPAHVDPVPAPVQPLADALAARVHALHPNATRVQIAYAGSFATVAVREIIPLGVPGDPTRRGCAWVEATLRVDPDGSVPGHYGMAMAAHGLLAHPAFPDEYATLPRFVDFTMPAELEGTSLLFGSIFRGPAADARQRLFRAIVDAAHAIDAGTYANPIEKLLAAQGESALPAHYSTVLEFTVSGYARTSGAAQQVNDRATFRVTARDALAAPVTQTYHSAQSGLTYEATVDLRAMTLSLTVTSPAGKTAHDRYPLAFPEGHGLVVDGDAVALDAGWMQAEVPAYPYALTLPGEGAFRAFDVYPESAIYASTVSSASAPASPP